MPFGNILPFLYQMMTFLRSTLIIAQTTSNHEKSEAPKRTVGTSSSLFWTVSSGQLVLDSFESGSKLLQDLCSQSECPALWGKDEVRHCMQADVQTWKKQGGG